MGNVTPECWRQACRRVRECGRRLSLSAECVCNHTVTSLLPHPDAQSKLINSVSALTGRLRNTSTSFPEGLHLKGFIFIVYMFVVFTCKTIVMLGTFTQ